MKYICIWLIKFYRKVLSPLKGKPCCRFVPTCSQYALEAFQKRGFFVGLALTVWRVLRCNPFCTGGYDPVPEVGFRYRGSRDVPASACDCHDHGDPCQKDDDRGGGRAFPDDKTASCDKGGEQNAPHGS